LLQDDGWTSDRWIRRERAAYSEIVTCGQSGTDYTVGVEDKGGYIVAGRSARGIA
jgi:hypothetical protein